MSYGKYVMEHGIWLVLFTVLTGVIEFFLFATGSYYWIMISVAVLLVGVYLLGTGLEYIRMKRYFMYLIHLKIKAL